MAPMGMVNWDETYSHCGGSPAVGPPAASHGGGSPAVRPSGEPGLCPCCSKPTLFAGGDRRCFACGYAADDAAKPQAERALRRWWRRNFG